MDEIDIAEGVESLNIGRENLFGCFGKLCIDKLNRCLKCGNVAIEMLRMKDSIMLRFECLPKYRIGMLHLIDGLVKVIENHHDHFLLGRLFVAFVDDG